MLIYCSKTMEAFLGSDALQTSTEDLSPLGQWNGHEFNVGRKKCILFMNNKSCYCAVMASVVKKQFKDIQITIKERIIHQFHHDYRLNESDEVILRRVLGDVVLTNSNNDKKILGTMNQRIMDLKFPNYQGGIDHWDELHISTIMNQYPIVTKLETNGKGNKYNVPLTLAHSLLASIGVSSAPTRLRY